MLSLKTNDYLPSKSVEEEKWSRGWDLNPYRTALQAVAWPLRHLGINAVTPSLLSRFFAVSVMGTGFY